MPIMNNFPNGNPINGLVKSYLAYAGENISAGDFVTFATNIDLTGGMSSTSDVTFSTANIYNLLAATQLSSTQVLLAYRNKLDSNYFSLVVLTISGGTITMGTPNRITGTVPIGVSLVTLTSTSALLFYGITSDYNYSCVVTISGTTVTTNTIGKLSSYSAATSCSATLLSANTVFVGFSNSTTGYIYGVIISISGTSVSYGSVYSCSIGSGWSASMCSVASISGTSVIFQFLRSAASYAPAQVAATISGGVITFGTYVIVSSGNYCGSGGAGNILHLGSGLVIAASYDSNGYKNYITTTLVSGTTITVKNSVNFGSNYNGPDRIIQLNSNQVIINFGNYYYVLVTVNLTDGSFTVLGPVIYSTPDSVISIVTANSNGVFGVLTIGYYSASGNGISSQLTADSNIANEVAKMRSGKPILGIAKSAAVGVNGGTPIDIYVPNV